MSGAHKIGKGMASFKSCNLLTITTMSTLAGNFTYWMPLYTFSSEYGQSLPKILYSLNGLNRLPTTSICSWICIKHNKSLEWVQVSISKLQDIKLRHSSRGKKTCPSFHSKSSAPTLSVYVKSEYLKVSPFDHHQNKKWDNFSTRQYIIF